LLKNEIEEKRAVFEKKLEHYYPMFVEDNSQELEFTPNRSTLDPVVETQRHREIIFKEWKNVNPSVISIIDDTNEIKISASDFILISRLAIAYFKNFEGLRFAKVNDLLWNDYALRVSRLNVRKKRNH